MQKSERVNLRMTPVEKAEAFALANSRGLSLTAFILVLIAEYSKQKEI